MTSSAENIKPSAASAIANFGSVPTMARGISPDVINTSSLSKQVLLNQSSLEMALEQISSSSRIYESFGPLIDTISKHIGFVSFNYLTPANSPLFQPISINQLTNMSLRAELERIVIGFSSIPNQKKAQNELNRLYSLSRPSYQALEHTLANTQNNETVLTSSSRSQTLQESLPPQLTSLNHHQIIQNSTIKSTNGLSQSSYNQATGPHYTPYERTKQSNNQQLGKSLGEKLKELANKFASWITKRLQQQKKSCA